MNVLLAASTANDEAAGIVLGSIIALLIICLIQYLIAKEFMRIAEEKGYYERKYLWLTFFLGIIGMLLVVALPDKRARNGKIEEDNTNLPSL